MKVKETPEQYLTRRIKEMKAQGAPAWRIEEQLLAMAQLQKVKKSRLRELIEKN